MAEVRVSVKTKNIRKLHLQQSIYEMCAAIYKVMEPYLLMIKSHLIWTTLEVKVFSKPVAKRFTNLPMTSSNLVILSYLTIFQLQSPGIDLKIKSQSGVTRLGNFLPIGLFLGWGGTSSQVILSHWPRCRIVVN
jgi:hypothetical protein